MSWDLKSVRMLQESFLVPTENFELELNMNGTERSIHNRHCQFKKCISKR